MIDNRIEEFIDGIFAMNTRRFGRVAELMIKTLYDFNDPENNAYDLLTNDKKKVEVKFSTVLKKCNSTITKENLTKQVISSKIDNRTLTYEDVSTCKFDCNIQQIKPKEFDILYYGCFFVDRIMICKIDSSKILKDENICFSERQHRGNVGEGQFHINNKTLEHHLKNYAVGWLTYEELFGLFN